MDWTAIGALGEVLGAVAVVVSVVYLAAQVRHNTEATRFQTFQSVIDRVAAVNSRTGDSHVAEALAKGRESYSNLAPAQRVTFDYYMQERFLMYESTLGLGHMLKPEIREAVNDCLVFHLAFPGVREWWTAPGREPMAQDFEDATDRLLASRLGSGTSDQSGGAS